MQIQTKYPNYYKQQERMVTWDQRKHYRLTQNNLSTMSTMWIFVLAMLAVMQVASTEQEQVEKSLISLFGMDKRPKIADRSKIPIPDELKDIYNEMMTSDYVMNSVSLPIPGVHAKSANTIRSFSHEESTIDDRFQLHHKFRLYFNVSSIPQRETLKAAELILSRKVISGNRKLSQRLLVFDIIKPGIKGKKEPIFLLVDSKSVRTHSDESVKMDVLPAVKRWLREPKENHGLLLQAISDKSDKPPSHRHIRLKRSLEDMDDDWQQQQPFLYTYTDDGQYKQSSIREVIATRQKRAPVRQQHRRKDGRQICQRKPLYIDFSSVGWSDWIIAPPGYDAYYCQGVCPFPLSEHFNSTNHAVVQGLINSVDKTIVPGPCCIPTQLNPISMIYIDNGNKVVLKNFQDMTVVGCGCR